VGTILAESTSITITITENSDYAAKAAVDLSKLVILSNSKTTGLSRMTANGLTFEIVQEPSKGSVTLNGSVATYQTKPEFSAADGFKFVAWMNGHSSNVGTVTILVNTRPQPTADTNLRNVLTAQFKGATRLAETQVTNVMRHLESAHSTFDCGLHQGITMSKTAQPSTNYISGKQHNAQNDSGDLTASVVASSASEKVCNNGALFRGWATGSIDFNSDRNWFETKGLTLGIDARVTDDLIVGAAVGYGTDETEFGSHTENSLAAKSVMGYASARLKPFIIFDLLGGYSELGMDTVRGYLQR
jgi:hypothetical protein